LIERARESIFAVVTTTNPVREEFLEPVRRTLRWLASLRGADGRIVCPEHKVEHTGKNAGVVVMACELLRLDPKRDREFLFELAVTEARRLCANLVCEENSVCHTFRPGRHDPFNCSNSVIDGGACSDALAHIVQALGDRLDPRDKARFAAASLLHARSYLRYAVLDKGIPAQRAWGLTGLASAWALEHDDILSSAAIEAIGVLEGIQHEDGSFPYHPIEWGALHPGSADVSAFYQSRVTGFTLFALERLGRDPRDPLFAAPLVRGLEFLTALQAPDGVKCGLVEAKPWYWGAEYEVASHPFDVFTLASGWRLFRREAYARAAVRAFRAWSAHLEPSGSPRSHLPLGKRSKSYQCPVFWAGHAMWMARALEDLESAAVVPPEPATRSNAIDLRTTWFPNAQLGRIEDGAVIAWVRGARPAVNMHHGGPSGAGLLRVWSKTKEADLLDKGHLRGVGEAEWVAECGHFSPSRGWRANHAELRFAFWLSRVAWRGGRPVDALRGPFQIAKRGLLDFATARASTAYDLAPTVEPTSDGLLVRAAFAHRDGTRVEGTAIERRFTIDGSGLSVAETIEESGRCRGIGYRVPKLATDVVRTPSTASYRLS
jgi:hypothetical protein